MIRRYDASSGYYYLENTATGETQWEEEYYAVENTNDIVNENDILLLKSNDEEEQSASESDDESDSSSSSSSDHESSDGEEDAYAQLIKKESPNYTEEDNDDQSQSSLGCIPILIPVSGIVTMIVTIVWSCTSRFDCHESYPTLSYAATFKPEGTAFTAGMVLTSLLIQTTISLFAYHLHLSLRKHRRVAYVFGTLVSGSIAAMGLFILAVYDMRNHHDVHVIATVVFFLAAWVTIAVCHVSRRLLYRRRRKTSSSAEDILEASDNVHKKSKKPAAFLIGEKCIQLGVFSSVVFGLLFLCVNKIIANPIGFTAGQEAFAELVAIICQLVYMGTLASDVSDLNASVERELQLQMTRGD